MFGPTKEIFAPTLKTSKNQRISFVFRGYKIGALARNGSIGIYKVLFIRKNVEFNRSDLGPCQIFMMERFCENSFNGYRSSIIFTKKYHSPTLRKKCPYSELFWSVFSRIRTRITLNTETFCAVLNTHLVRLHKSTNKNATKSFYDHWH